VIPKDTLLWLGARWRRASWPVLLALAVGVLLLGRELLVRGTLARAGSGARQLAEVSREVLPDPNPTQGLRREAFFWLLAPEADDRPGVSSPSAGDRASPSSPSSPRLGPVPAPVVSLSSSVVLGLAERGAVPRGKAVPASPELPAGIEIIDGAALGIGWHPGDRLVLVDGVPVADRAEVVRRVLEGRARRAPVVTATVARRTKSGVFTYRVLVEQPYPIVEADADLASPGAETPGPP
jgi:hypothetical protein